MNFGWQEQKKEIRFLSGGKICIIFKGLFDCEMGLTANFNDKLQFQVKNLKKEHLSYFFVTPSIESQINLKLDKIKLILIKLT